MDLLTGDRDLHFLRPGTGGARFRHVKNRGVLGTFRTDQTWATTLVRALLVLTNREVAR
ncbi:hypothetical protein ABZ865_39345 [Streptomyces sp. NPDC047085]|uniref:hypothetical protein n=1 Tax=Streptomyces sp. NPDC047085 TaxID=3155140 RepID=UPI0033C8E647